MEVPLWLAKALASKQIVKVETPKAYTSINMGNLKAEPISVGLSKFPYFFEVGVDTLVSK